MLLRDEGYDVWTLYRGSEVPHATHEFDSDVALIDIGMPIGWKQSSDRILAKLL